MQIFISFASEQRETAELIAVVLRERGYNVFFSRDTLPAAETFDVRIERAVKSSDLFVFLVSPQSVTRGKYTLTELAYAREKWPRPSGHVLPVVIAPTPLETIPVYLRSVSLFDPEGNVAADTAAQADKLLRKRSRWSVASIALGGAATGVLSYLVGEYMPNVLRFALVSSGDDTIPSSVSILPGLFFGALIAFCNFRFGLRDKFQLGAVILFVTVSWVLAYNTTVITFTQIDKYSKEMPAPSTTDPGTNNDGGTTSGDGTGSSDTNVPPQSEIQTPQKVPIIGMICGLVGGLVGGAGTLLSVAIVNRRLRRIEKLLPILAVAILIGMLVQVAIQPGNQGLVGYAVLFICWQAAVAGMIARVLCDAEPGEPHGI